jgi:uncharacterized protein YcnI
VPAGGFVLLDVRVPNERENASTVKVHLRLPPGFIEASYQPVTGWTVKEIRKKLAKPTTNDEGETITDQVSDLIWTGDGKQGKIAPGQFMDFPLSVQIPDKPGTSLTFKALQTYRNGEVVRWIGAPDSDTPAPQVAVTASSETPASSATTTAISNEDASRANLALGFGIAGLIAGLAALLLVLVRRTRPATP